MHKWLGKFWRFMLLVIAIVTGYLASAFVGSWLAPQPVFEVPMQAGESASLHQNVLSITKNYKTLRTYRVSDGAQLDVTNYRRAAAIKHPLEGTDTRSEVTYFAQKFSVRNTPDIACMLFDSTTGEGFQFLRFRDSAFIRIEVESSRPVQAYLMRQPIPFHLLAGLSGSIASLSYQLPQLIHVISLPNNKVISSLVLDAAWYFSNLKLSPSGRYLACVRGEVRSNNAQKWAAEQRVWDTNLGLWIQLESNLMQQAEFFVNDEVFVGRACQATNRSANGGMQFVNARTGKLIDQLPAPPHYSIYQNEVYASSDTFYYQKSHEVELGRFRCNLMMADSEHAEVLQSHEVTEGRPGGYIVAGQQSIYSRSPSFQLWLFQQYNTYFAKWFGTRSLLQYQTTYIHDWKSNRSVSVWSGYHVCWPNHDGTYLLVMHGLRDESNSNLVGNGLAQVFHMPLVLYSPWWHRGTGLGVFVLLVLGYWVYRRRLRVIVPRK